MVKLKASDLHFKSNARVHIRHKGELRPVNEPALTPQQVQDIWFEIMNEHQRNQLLEKGASDFAYQLGEGDRFRVNIFRQRGSLSVAARRVSAEIMDFKALYLPDSIFRITEFHQGLVLLAGITGSGKSTTIAAALDYINQTRACHIVTIEDPIEYLFQDKKSLVNQREVGVDVQNFRDALKYLMREDPDVVLVGEMRDEETIETALHASETGHLVMSTLHTLDAVETVNRIIGMFPPHQQNQIRIALASVLKGVISQRLVTRADGKGMIPSVEILVMTHRIRELIEDPKRTREIRDAIAGGRNPYGMMTFDQCLTDLVMKKLITYETALAASTTPDDFALYFRGIAKAGDAVAQDVPGQPATTPVAAPPADGNLELDRVPGR
jgi:twitching motility protein PilT